MPLSTPQDTHSHPHGDHTHRHALPESAGGADAGWMSSLGNSVLGWPAWFRVLTVLPVVLVLWLAVWWANAGVNAW